MGPYWLSFQRGLFSGRPTLWWDLGGIWHLTSPWVGKELCPPDPFSVSRIFFISPLPVWKINVLFYISVISLSSNFQMICSGTRTPHPPITAEPTVKSLPMGRAKQSLSSPVVSVPSTPDIPSLCWRERWGVDLSGKSAGNRIIFPIVRSNRRPNVTVSHQINRWREQNVLCTTTNFSFNIHFSFWIRNRTGIPAEPNALRTSWAVLGPPSTTRAGKSGQDEVSSPGHLSRNLDAQHRGSARYFSWVEQESVPQVNQMGPSTRQGQNNICECWHKYWPHTRGLINVSWIGIWRNPINSGFKMSHTTEKKSDIWDWLTQLFISHKLL